MEPASVNVVNLLIKLFRVSVCFYTQPSDNFRVYFMTCFVLGKKTLNCRSMRFRISWIAFVTFVVFCFCALYVVFRQDWPPSNAQIDEAHTVTSDSASFAADGWVLDCITWDKKRQASTPEDVQDFGLSRTFADGESTDQRRLFFHRIFAGRDWPADDPSYHGLKASGPGSMLRNAQNMIAILHSVTSHVRSYLGKSTVSLFDVACGDMQWMPYFLEARKDVVYTGADIVPDIVTHHKKRLTLKRFRNAEFIEHDVVSTPLNRSYDIVLVRDVLQHLWMVDAMMALKRVSDSGSKFLLATTFPDTFMNMDVNKEAIGGGRKASYNLEQSPFSLVAPVCSSYDWNVEHISLWRLPLKQIAE